MLKKTIKFVDFDGNQREEEFCFHITPARMTMLQNSVKGGMKARLEKAIAEQDGPVIMDLFAKIIDLSYGEKSLDGRNFIQNDEVLARFKSSNAYNELFMELVTDEAAAKAFADKVLPDMSKYAEKAQAKA